MAERLNRFLKLEGARQPEPADATAPALPEELQAKRREQLQSGLALDEHPDDEQPFVRCGQCETDGPRGAVRCKTCGAALDTPEQRAFNEALWQARRAEIAREKEESLALASASPPDGEMALIQAQRALGESLAAAVRERESERLEWMGAREFDRLERRSLGVRLLEILPASRAGIATTIGVVGLLALLLLKGCHVSG